MDVLVGAYVLAERAAVAYGRIDPLRVVLEDPVEEIDRKGIQRYAREVGNLSVAVADHPLRVDCRNQLLHGLAGRGVGGAYGASALMLFRVRDARDAGLEDFL